MNKKPEQMTRYTFRVTKLEREKLQRLNNASKLLRAFINQLPAEIENQEIEFSIFIKSD